jgi:hypothetical protein
MRIGVQHYNTLVENASRYQEKKISSLQNPLQIVFTLIIHTDGLHTWQRGLCMRFLLLIFLLIAAPAILAQRQANNWYFGRNGGITFQPGYAAPEMSGKIRTMEGCASYSDPNTGQLLFYTDGVTVWNRFHRMVKNGDGLKGGFSSTQSALIVPNPANPDEFYIFTAPNAGGISPYTSGLHYSIISLITPEAEIISKNKLLVDFVAEKLTATKNCSGNGYWIVAHDKFKSRFYAFSLTGAGIQTTPVISNYSAPDADNTIGALKFSPDGNKLAMASYMDIASNTYISRIFLFSFNPQNGIVGNFIDLSAQNTYGCYGVSFSPDNTRLYFTGSTLKDDVAGSSVLFQYDLINFDAASIRNSQFIINTELRIGGALQLGPDGRLYILFTYPSGLGMLAFPNRDNNASTLITSILPQLNAACWLGLPNFMDFIFGISADTLVLCQGEKGVIGPSPRPGYTYQWSPTQGLSAPDQPNPIAAPPTSIQYTLQVKGPEGCIAKEYYTVKVLNSAFLRTNSPEPVCQNTPVQLLASGALRYEWWPKEGLSAANIPNPIVNTDVSRTYKVIGYNEKCIDSAFVKVIVENKPVLDAGPDKSVCAGSITEIGPEPIAGYSYQWAADTTLSYPYAARVHVWPSQDTRYILKMRSPAGCEVYDTVLVRVQNSLKAQVLKDTVYLCAGDSALISISGGNTCNWQPAENLLNPKSYSTLAYPRQSTVYKGIISSGNCTDTALVHVIVRPALSNPAGIDHSICPGMTIQLGDSLNPSDWKYLWQPVEFLDNPFIARPICSAIASTRYILTAISPDGCIQKDTVQIHSNGNLQLRIKADTVICKGQEIRLSVSGADTYEWYPAVALDNPMIASPLAQPMESITYYVKGKSGNCNGIDSITIKVMPMPEISIPKDTLLCIGNSVQIQGGSAEQWQWYPSIGIDNPRSAAPVFTPAQSTMYYVEAKSGNCTQKDSLYIAVNPLPSTKIYSSMQQPICSGTQVILKADGAENYIWFQGNQQIAMGKDSIAVSPLQTTQYIVQGNKGNCTVNDTITIQVSAKPTLQIMGNNAICKGSVGILQTQEYISAVYEWDGPGIIGSKNQSSITIQPNATAHYTVRMQLSGCTVLDTFTVYVQDKPQLQIQYMPAICSDEILSIRAQGASQWKWYPDSLIQNANTAAPQIAPASSGWYYVQAFNGECSTIDSIYITVNPRIQSVVGTNTDSTYSPGDTAICSIQLPEKVSQIEFLLTAQDPSGISFLRPEIVSPNIQYTISPAHSHSAIISAKDMSRIDIPVRVYLPAGGAMQQKITMHINEFQSTDCIQPRARDIILQYNPDCAWNIRSIQAGQGKFLLQLHGRTIFMQSALQGTAHCEVYTLEGRHIFTSSQYIQQPGEIFYFEIPSITAGIYAIRCSQGPWQESMLILLQENSP